MELLVIPGDGIGAEVTHEACRVAEWFIAKGMDLTLVHRPFGLEVWNAEGRLVSDETMELVRKAPAILFGAIGGEEYHDIPLEIVREQGLLKIRRDLDLFANLRPVRYWEPLASVCPLTESTAMESDLLIVRELSGGLYYGEPRGISEGADGKRVGVNTMSYDEDRIRRIIKAAVNLAQQRSGQLMSVDKSNVLEVSQLWRSVAQEEARKHADVTLRHMLVDNCALQLVRNPRQFDTIVTENLFGDILSDCAGAISGSLGMLPSASLNIGEDGEPRQGLYEPVHGSAPDIAGQGIANPIGSILSLALALRYSFGLPLVATMIEEAVNAALLGGARTSDIDFGQGRLVSTSAMGDAILDALERLSQNYTMKTLFQ